MNNWGLRKFLVGEVDVFKIDRTHELYGHMNINYLKLDRVPEFGDASAVGEALRRGDYFITTGEVLLHDYRLDRKVDEVSGELDISWTLPLNFYEIVWGDGVETHRTRIPLARTGQFGREKFRFRERCPGVKWARIAVWDIAANGALTQPE